MVVTIPSLRRIVRGAGSASAIPGLEVRADLLVAETSGQPTQIEAFGGGQAFREEFARAVAIAAQRPHPRTRRVRGRHEVHTAAFGR
ncbi:hypothetical protein [Nocardia sp. NPDC047654]|uniref:hypothetical protein n=1 Tax=Nocardia sp. NPDC047654 TaxID=3364314 RepID=UPI00371968EE